MLVATALNLVIVIFGYDYGVRLPMSKPAFDWFDPDNFSVKHSWFNTTLIRVVEGLISVGFLWMIR